MSRLVDLSDAAERIAQRLVGSVLDVEIDPVDGVMAGDGLHDFDLVHDDGMRDALEVTVCTDPVRVALYDALRRHENVLSAPNLERSWSLWLAEGASVKRAASRVVRVLERVEADGFRAFGFGQDRRWPSMLERRDGSRPPHWEQDENGNLVATGRPESVAAMRDLGVASGFDVERSGDPIVVLHPPSASGWSNPDRVVEAVEDEADENAEKLARAAADGRRECHLLVWVDGPRAFDVEFALTSAEISQARSPEVHESITSTWIAAYTVRNGDPQVVVWRWIRGGGWETIEVDVDHVMGA